VDFSQRGRIFDRQLEALGRFWNGDGGIGPSGRPRVLVGGTADVSYRRAARYADGWTSGGGGPENFAKGREKAIEAWRAEGRDGVPRTMALFYFALGDDAEAAVQRSLGDYYAFAGEYAGIVASGALKDPQAVRERVAAFEAAGCDELVIFPCDPDPAQVDLLADALAAM
jgi:alkanesulfonate monooxygenase SsuD/methylene tetrahydromethanopterin reductase-like flavin-dependent oxidoreductase (luciferase family)